MEVTITKIDKCHAQDTWLLRNDPYVWKFARYDAPMPATIESESAFYERMSKSTEQDMYAILVDGRAVGAVTLKSIKAGTLTISWYILDRSLWNKGVGKRAVSIALGYAFTSHHVDLVIAWVHYKNVGSLKLALGLGFYAVGRSLINEQVYRLEITSTKWKSNSEKSR